MGASHERPPFAPRLANPPRHASAPPFAHLIFSAVRPGLALESGALDARWRGAELHLAVGVALHLLLAARPLKVFLPMWPILKAAVLLRAGSVSRCRCFCASAAFAGVRWAAASLRCGGPAVRRASVRLCVVCSLPEGGLACPHADGSLRVCAAACCCCSGVDSVCVHVRWASAVLWRGLLSVWQASGCFWHFSVPCGLLLFSHCESRDTAQTYT